MRPPGRSSRGRPPPAAPPPPQQKRPPRRPVSKKSTTTEALLATSQPSTSASASAPASASTSTSALPQAPSLNEVLSRQQSQASPKPILSPYTVSWSVLWRGKEVFSGVKSSEEFDYDTFSGDSIIKVSRKADDKGYKTVLQHATAVVACSGNQANITVQCGDSDEWNDVSGVAKRWLEDKKKGVAVKILHKYDRKEASLDSESSASSTPMSPPKKKRKAQKEKYRFSSDNSSSTETSSSEDSDSDSDSDSKRKKKKKTQKGKKKKTRQGTSTTAKQKEFYQRIKELDEKRGRYGHKLMKRWFCDSAACGNKNHYCWQPEGASQTHLKLFDKQICDWNTALAKGKSGVTIDNPPKATKIELFSMHSQAQGAKKKQKEVENINKEAAPPTISTATLPGFQTATSYWQNSVNPQWPPALLTQYPYYPVQQPSFPPGQHPYSSLFFHQAASQQDPPPELTLPQRQIQTRLPSRPSTAEKRHEPARYSSPVQVEGDVGRLRREYFHWQIGRNRSEQSAITSALRTVEKEMWTVRDIRKFENSDWIRMQIPPGLGKRLAAEVKTWLKERQNGGQRSSLDDLVDAALAAVQEEPLDDLGLDGGDSEI